MKRCSASLDMRQRNADHTPQGGDFTRTGSATAERADRDKCWPGWGNGGPRTLLVGPSHGAATVHQPGSASTS